MLSVRRDGRGKHRRIARVRGQLLLQSWTLRLDLVAPYVCRVLNTMAEKGADVACPALPADHGMAQDDIVKFSSGYLQRARHLLPRSAAALPWRLNMNYLEDRRDFRTRPVEDGVLRFTRLGQ